MVVGQTVQNMLMLAVGILFLTGVIVGVTALKGNQYSYVCGDTSQGANGTVNCYSYLTPTKTVAKEVAKEVNTTKTNNLANKNLRLATCVISAAMNHSNSLKIPVGNWTEITECAIRQTKASKWSNVNWTVNYTVTWSNLTSSTLTATPNSAYNLTSNVESMTQSFGEQLGTIGVMFGVGLIIAVVSIVGIGLMRKNE